MRVLITGATSGIGRSCAFIFARHGCGLIITGRRAERLSSLKKELESEFKIRVTTLSFDIRDKKSVDSAIDGLSAAEKTIDVLVNNAGLAAGLSSIQAGNVDHWERMIDTNVKGLLYITRKIAPMMCGRNSGHIINIGSIAGKEVYPNGNVYCATKHAVDALNKGMRMDLLPFNVKVTAVNPGMVETEFSVVRFDGDEERAKKVYLGFEPLTPDDIAETVYWCATRPAHVNINDLTIMPAAQASATVVNRS